MVLAPLLALNTVLAVTAQARASRGTDTVPGSIAALRRAGSALAGCCVLLALVPSVPVPAAVGLLVAAMLALTAGELWQSAGGWGLSYAMAPAAHQGVYLSTFNIGVTAQQVFGPGLIAVAVIPLGPWGWSGIALLLVVVTGLAPLLLRSAPEPATTAVI